MGLARMGSYAGNGSGDIFLAFSTANPNAAAGKATLNQAQFSATITSTACSKRPCRPPRKPSSTRWSRRATCAAKAGRYAKAIPHDALVRLLKHYGRYHPGKQ